MRSRVRSIIVALTSATLLGGAAAAASFAAPASAAQQTSLTIESPARVSVGWNGDFAVSGYSENDEDWINVTVSGPGYYESDYGHVADYGPFRKSFDFPSFSRAGTYEISVDTDNSSATAYKSVEATVGAPAFTVASVSRESFYPTVRDGYQDYVTLRWRPNGRLPVEVDVLNAAGRKVMKWPRRTWSPYADRLNWYGKNGNGEQLPTGRYRVRMVAFGEDGRTATKILPVRIVSDVVTKRTTDSWNGLQTFKRQRRGDCYMQGWSYDGSLDMNCYDYDGGSMARAEWWFRLPSSATKINWGVNGRIKCCSPGAADKSGKRVRRDKFVVSMRTTGLRSFTVNYAWVAYSYKQRR